MKKNIIEPKKIIQDQSLVLINPSARMKRIMKELDQYVKNPHPSVKILPCIDDYSFWKALLIGPEGTPYEKGQFVMYIQFP